MLDAVMYYKQFTKKPNLKVKDNFILCTIYRAENTDNIKRLKNIFEALKEIAKEIQIILPLHPGTKNILEKSSIPYNNITIVKLVGYFEMLWLLNNCKMVMTDSGGLQKEAYFFKKPCITLRGETEWIELVEIGANTLAGADKEKILNAYKNSLKYNIQNMKLDLYGNANTSKIIVEELISYE